MRACITLFAILVGCSNGMASDLDRFHAACVPIRGANACSAECIEWIDSSPDCPYERPADTAYGDCVYDCAASSSTNVDCDAVPGGYHSAGCDCHRACAAMLSAEEQRLLADSFECLEGSAAGRCD